MGHHLATAQRIARPRLGAIEQEYGAEEKILAEVAGAALPRSQPVDGQSLVPLFGAEPPGAALTDRAIFWFTPLYLRGSAETAQKPVYGTDYLYWRGVPAAVVMKGAYKLTRFFEDGSLELYDVEKDPDCLHNLAGEEAHQDIKRTLQARLRRFMEESNDHALAPFLKRNNPTALAVYMKKVQDESVQRRAARRKGKNKNKAKQKGPRKKAP